MRLVVLGDPIGHSRSPAIHTAALAAAGIDGSYTARRVDEEGLQAAVEEIRAGLLDGANVTMPHKAAAARAADRSDDLVQRTGAANTLRRSPGWPAAVEATNTDVGGLRGAAAAAGIPEGAPVLVLGGGGAAAAAFVAFADREVRCSTRSARVGIVRWGEGREGVVIVNATPLGMAGENLPEGVWEGAVGLIDLPYADGATPAVERARRLGIPVADGLDVLVSQAAISFTWWTGADAPIAAMQQAARR